MGEVIIRRACRDDVTDITRIEEETSGAPWSEASIRHDVAENERAYVACIDECGSIIGYADIWLIAGEAELNNIAVTGSRRRLGYGSRLLDHMIGAASDAGCGVMHLEVRAGNAAAISMYLRHGFIRVGLRQGYYEDNGEDAVLMDRSLK